VTGGCPGHNAGLLPVVRDSRHTTPSELGGDSAETCESRKVGGSHGPFPSRDHPSTPPGRTAGRRCRSPELTPGPGGFQFQSPGSLLRRIRTVGAVPERPHGRQSLNHCGSPHGHSQCPLHEVTISSACHFGQRQLHPILAECEAHDSGQCPVAAATPARRGLTTVSRTSPRKGSGVRPSSAA
jgi:hypothetical protein